jgi:hypothetical protein
MGPALNYSLMLQVCSDKMYTMAAGGNCCFGGEYDTSGGRVFVIFRRCWRSRQQALL